MASKGLWGSAQTLTHQLSGLLPCFSLTLSAPLASFWSLSHTRQIPLEPLFCSSCLKGSSPNKPLGLLLYLLQAFA